MTFACDVPAYQTQPERACGSPGQKREVTIKLLTLNSPLWLLVLSRGWGEERGWYETGQELEFSEDDFGRDE